jgi:hypothetical protein
VSSTTILVYFLFGLMVVFQQPSKQKENKQHNAIQITLHIEPPIKRQPHLKKDWGSKTK